MKKLALSILFTLFLCTCQHLQGATITASEFNQLYSCQNPFVATETTNIILDEDIVISESCELIKAGSGFDPIVDAIIFISEYQHAVVINQAQIWSIGLPIIFDGNAKLQTQPGSVLALQNDITIRMSGQSSYIPTTT